MLLAAGASRRLGQPKALLRRDGEPLVRRVARLLLETAPSECVVVVGDGHDAISQALAGLPVRVVPNPDWRDGLSASLRRGAEALAAHAGSTLIATLDQLHLDAAHLCALRDAPDPARDAVSAYAGTCGVPARVSRATLDAARTLRGDRGFGVRWATLRPPPHRIVCEALAFDLDTPDDLAHARAQGWIDPA
nr:nucleotidyltransferase family protein [Chiayiivirga flava]